jgi:hypothetical protein
MGENTEGEKRMKSEENSRVYHSPRRRLRLERHFVEDAADEVVGGESFDAGIVFDDNPVAQYGCGDETHILEGGVRTLMNQGAGFGCGG